MARNTKARKGKKNTETGGGEWKTAVRISFGLFFAAAAVYTFISLLSYGFTWAGDQSLLTQDDIFKSDVVAANAGGKAGFLWADLLISKLFGLGAFTLPFFIGAISVFCFRIRRVNLVKVFIICATGTIIFSIAAAYITSFFNTGEWLGGAPGGSYGGFATVWLTNATGAVGAGCLILVAFAVWLMLFSGKVALWFDRCILFTARCAARTAQSTMEKLEGAVADDDEMAAIGKENAESSEERTEPEQIEPSQPEYPMEPEEVAPQFYEEPETIIQPEPEYESAPEPEPTVPAVQDAEEVPLSVEESENDFLINLSEEEKARIFDPRLDLPRYERPPLSMLNDYRSQWYDVPLTELEKNKQRIVNALANYKIGVSGIVASKGPTVTLYKIRLAEGIKVAQVRRLEEDIAISLGTKGVRVVTLTDSVGIEVPNEHASVVPLKSVLNSPQFKEANMELPLALGITVTNEPFFLDLGKMPHLLVAGATGMGKSVGLNCIVASLLYCKHPAEIKFVMVDPKKVELSLYSKLEKHFLAKLPDGDEAIITDTKKVIWTLKSLCIEMDDRYELMKQADVRQVKEYNEKFLNRKLNPGRGHKFMPYIVVVVDEFADLITTAGREIEEPIARLAQKARAVGIHLVLATQRPTTDIITGTIKSNFNARIAFKVNSMVDSRTIIDTPGANRLIGRGDMLVVAPNKDLTRVQCALIDKEVDSIVKFINAQPGYAQPYYLPEYEEEGEDGGGSESVDLRKRDKLFEEAAKIIVQYQQGSTSLLQRKLNLGYNRAGRLIDQLEAAGIVGPFEGSKARQVLITDFDTLDHKLESLDHQTIV